MELNIYHNSGHKDSILQTLPFGGDNGRGLLPREPGEDVHGAGQDLQLLRLPSGHFQQR